MPPSYEKTCFLLLPGFAPDNFPMLSLRNKLISLGYHAVALPFWGDVKVDDFSKLTIEECKNGIAHTIDSLSQKYETVIGIGTSLGGALLIEHAKSKDDLGYIISIGTPFKLKNRMIIEIGFFLYPLIRLIYDIGEFIGVKRLLPIAFGKTMVTYFEGDFLQNLEKVKTPLLLLHGKNDGVTEASVLPSFLDKIKSVKKKIIYFKKLDHTMVYDDDLIIKLTFDFLNS